MGMDIPTLRPFDAYQEGLGLNLWCTDRCRCVCFKVFVSPGSFPAPPTLHRPVQYLRDFATSDKARTIPSLKMQSCSLSSLWSNSLANL